MKKGKFSSMLELACTVVCGKANCSIFRNFASQLKAQLKLQHPLHWSVVPWLETHQKQWSQHSWFLNIYPYIARWIGWRIGGEQKSCSWMELMKNSQRDEKFKDCKRQCRKYRNGGSKEICRVIFFFKKIMLETEGRIFPRLWSSCQSCECKVTSWKIY